MMMSNRTYDAIKWVAQYFLPALATLVFTLSAIWGIPNSDKIISTIVALDAFLGLLLGLTAAQYNSKNKEQFTCPPEDEDQLVEKPSNSILFTMSEKTYDVLIWVAQYFLPAVATLVFALGGVWEFQYTEQVVGTITAFDAFLGIVLGISTAQYNAAKKEQKENADDPEYRSGPDGG